jgi:hypothetical protein
VSHSVVDGLALSRSQSAREQTAEEEESVVAISSSRLSDTEVAKLTGPAFNVLADIRDVKERRDIEEELAGEVEDLGNGDLEGADSAEFEQVSELTQDDGGAQDGDADSESAESDDDASRQAEPDSDNDGDTEEVSSKGKQRSRSAEQYLEDTLESADQALRQLASLNTSNAPSIPKFDEIDWADDLADVLIVERDSEEPDQRAFYVYADDDDELDRPWSVSWDDSGMQIEIPVDDPSMLPDLVAQVETVEKQLSSLTGTKVTVSFRLIEP